MKPQVISSRLTYLYKNVVPIVIGLIILFALYGVLNLFKYNAIDIAVFLIIIIIYLSYVIFRNLLRLKKVSFDKEYIYIDNYKKTDKVSIKDIEEIKRKQVYLYKIQFNKPTYFGKSIIFMPSFSKMSKGFFLTKPEGIKNLEEFIKLSNR